MPKLHSKSNLNHPVDILFILGLFLIFTITAIAVVLIGVGIFQFTVRNMDDNYELRTVHSYICEKIRQNDASGSIRTQYKDGVSCLVFRSTVSDTNYVTYIYCYDGYLRELLVSEDYPFDPASGQTVMELSSFSVIQTRIPEPVYSCTITNQQGEKESFLLSSKSTY